MRLGWAKKGNSVSYYVHKTVGVNGKNKSVVIKRLGSEKFICQTYGVSDAKAWAKEQVRLMNEAEQNENGKYLIELNANTDLNLKDQRRFNGGYLFLQSIYYELGLHKICRAIATKHDFDYDLNDIMSKLIYTRIMYPCSKKSSFEEAKRFIENPSFKLHDIYRSLSVIAEESDYIQSRLFKNSIDIAKRNTGVIYYDCTNFYFEIEKAEDDKQYGASKENRPLPIVEMGLFMDSDGIPIAFGISPGNSNEQGSMIPLEKKIIDTFDISKFVVCTDAGLSSGTNRIFNSYDREDGSRAFVTTQSLKEKKIKSYLRDWALDSKGWKLPGDPSGKTYDLDDLDDENDLDKIFYKSRWVNEPVEVMTDRGTKKSVPLEQQLIVSYSIKYRNYMRKIREGQIQRATAMVERGETEAGRKRQNDPKRFIHTDHATPDGEIAEKQTSYVDESIIECEAKYDGFYAICTNLSDDPQEIVKINKRRWEIEECFRIMKTDFEARPVYVKRKDRILAHFITCFIALIVYRYLERKLDNKYTISQILDTLREMDFVKFEGSGYVPVYTRTELTDVLHEVFGFNTSKEILSSTKMRNICSKTKNRMHNVRL